MDKTTSEQNDGLLEQIGRLDSTRIATRDRCIQQSGAARGHRRSIVFALLLAYTPFLHPVFGTAALPVNQLLLVIPFPFIIWGADELRRLWRRRRAHRRAPSPTV